MSDVPESEKTTEKAKTAEEPAKVDSPHVIPIAARLAAEPGWRAIILEPGDDDKSIRILIVAIEQWALEAPHLKFQSASFMTLMSLIGADQSTMLWPIYNNARVPMERLYAIIPPCETTSEALLEEAKAKLAQENEKADESTKGQKP